MERETNDTTLEPLGGPSRARLLACLALIALVGAALMAAALPARGQTVAVRSCTADRSSCVTVVNPPSADPRVIQVPRRDADPERERAWQDFCKPATVTDALGVERYTYAHKGCEYGRTH